MFLYDELQGLVLSIPEIQGRFQLEILNLSYCQSYWQRGCITGWALTFHYDNRAKSAGSQKELKNYIQVADAMPLELDHKNIILVLVCIGLIGFFGVRRQSKTLENLVRVKHSGSRAHANFLNEHNPERQTGPGKLNIQDKIVVT